MNNKNSILNKKRDFIKKKFEKVRFFFLLKIAIFWQMIYELLYKFDIRKGFKRSFWILKIKRSC